MIRLIRNVMNEYHYAMPQHHRALIVLGMAREIKSDTSLPRHEQIEQLRGLNLLNPTEVALLFILCEMPSYLTLTKEEFYDLWHILGELHSNFVLEDAFDHQGLWLRQAVQFSAKWVEPSIWIEWLATAEPLRTWAQRQYFHKIHTETDFSHRYQCDLTWLEKCNVFFLEPKHEIIMHFFKTSMLRTWTQSNGLPSEDNQKHSTQWLHTISKKEQHVQEDIRAVSLSKHLIDNGFIATVVNWLKSKVSDVSFDSVTYHLKCLDALYPVLSKKHHYQLWDLLYPGMRWTYAAHIASTHPLTAYELPCVQQVRYMEGEVSELIWLKNLNVPAKQWVRHLYMMESNQTNDVLDVEDGLFNLELS